MMTNLRWLCRDIVKQLWFTVALYCLLAVGTALSAPVLEPLIPSWVSSKIGADAVDHILGILAASMLTVATFSMSTMVQAFASSGTGATPRATQLVVEDRTAQQALATFIGTFVFSLVGLIALSTGSYGPSGRLILFVVTIGVIILIVVMLLRWIQRLSQLGRLGETVDQVERVTLKAIKERGDRPWLGARPAIAVPEAATPLPARQVGYITRIDMDRLSAAADKAGCAIHIAALPGAFMTLDRMLAFVHGPHDEALRQTIVDCFLIASQRSFDHDPRFGLIVLSEVASRGLPPTTHDSGTAIHVIGVIVRLLTAWATEKGADRNRVLFERLYVKALTAEQLVVDAIRPIARDGAGVIEVAIRLQKGLGALAKLDDPELAAVARDQAAKALMRAEQVLSFEDDIERLRAVRGDRV